MMGFEFETSSDPFSIFNAVQAIAVVIFLIIEGSLKSDEA